MSVPAFPIADADKCVKCALCLPHCPTYRVSKDEGESPRGRIALMQGMATGALDLTPRLAAHLDQCLACRACEAVCPAEVPYGKLIDAGRAELRRRGHGESLQARLFAFFMRGAARRRLLQAMLRLSGRIGLHHFLMRSGPASLQRLIRLLPAVPMPKRWDAAYEPRKQRAEKVSLFLGCVADISQPQVTASAIAVLNAIGIEVLIPKAQGCCGALDQHAGRGAQAAQLARANLAAFPGEGAILGTASGCTASLVEYEQLAGPEAKGFAARVQDIAAWLGKDEILPQIEFKSWNALVLVQAPCTQRNVLKTEKAGFDLLTLIPDLMVKAIPASMGCCGAAGSYMLTEAEKADAFADAYAVYIQEQKANALITSNVGCAMHLRAALARRGVRIPVLHPIEVLAQQLPDAMYRPGMDITISNR
ncbi:MAG TPA: (Fe-S)-binding protein [Gammaproteobacteria bacterium]|jgi:glycolate oxidase iron-sulfur subunit